MPSKLIQLENGVYAEIEAVPGETIEQISSQQADEIYGRDNHHLLTPIQCKDDEADEFFQQLAEGCRLGDLGSILEISGGHPRLVETCLQNQTTHLAQCQQLLNTLAIVSELFIPFRDDAEQLHTLLQQETLERYSAWPANPLIRKLYWHNLITQRGESFVWRSGFIRELEMDKLGE